MYLYFLIGYKWLGNSLRKTHLNCFFSFTGQFLQTRVTTPAPQATQRRIWWGSMSWRERVKDTLFFHFFVSAPSLTSGLLHHVLPTQEDSPELTWWPAAVHLLFFQNKPPYSSFWLLSTSDRVGILFWFTFKLQKDIKQQGHYIISI